MAENEKKEKKPLTKKRKIIRSVVVAVIIVAIVVLAYYILVWTGAWEYINSVDKIRELILSLGFWGRFAFVMLQFLQVTFLPIPSTISTLAGVLIYGPLQTALLSLAGIMLGSVLAFWLGRQFGRKLVVFMVGEETCKKWTDFLTNAKYSFVVMMVLPIFPDDVLCLVAGLTNMTWKFFVLTNLIARPIGIFMTCYLGSGELIPYHGWGLVAWAFIIVLVGILLYLTFKYRPQIENFLKTKFRSKKATSVNVEAGREVVAQESKQHQTSEVIDENVNKQEAESKPSNENLDQNKNDKEGI